MNQAPTAPSIKQKIQGTIFYRIYLTLVLATLLFVAIASIFIWSLSKNPEHEWAVEIADQLEDISIGQHFIRGPNRRANRKLGVEQIKKIEEIESSAQVHLSLHAVQRIRTNNRKSNNRPPRRASLGPDLLTKQSQGNAGIELSARQLRRLRRGESLLVQLPNGDQAAFIPIHTERKDKAPRLAAIAIAVPKSQTPLLLAIGTVLFLLLLGVAAWPLSRSLSQRISRLERAARKLASGELSTRINPERGSGEKAKSTSQNNPGGDEIDRLSTSFDHMADRLEHAIRGQQRLLTNVSHELRTPLTRMRLSAELLLPPDEQSSSSELKNLRPEVSS